MGPGPDTMMKPVGGGGETAKPPVPAGPGAGAGPMGGPMASPSGADGLKTNAKMQVAIAMDTLGAALPDLDVKTEEGQAVMKALQLLNKAFGGGKDAQARELIPSEVMTLLGGLPQQNPGPGPAAAAAIPPAGVGNAPIPQS